MFNAGSRSESSVALCTFLASQVARVVKNLPANAGDLRDEGLTLGQKDLLEKEMATHSSSLACKIPWTEESVGYTPWSLKESDMTEVT